MFVSVMRMPGTTALFGSWTVPRIDPRCVWASAPLAVKRISVAMKAIERSDFKPDFLLGL
jgi:hypothetical protein